jgi:hypothetical protein
MAVSTLGILGQSAADLAAQIARYKRAGHITLRTLGEAREQARRHHERAMNYIASVRAELAGMAAIEAQEMDALGRDLAEAAVTVPPLWKLLRMPIQKIFYLSLLLAILVEITTVLLIIQQAMIFQMF